MFVFVCFLKNTGPVKSSARSTLWIIIRHVAATITCNCHYPRIKGRLGQNFLMGLAAGTLMPRKRVSKEVGKINRKKEKATSCSWCGTWTWSGFYSLLHQRFIIFFKYLYLVLIWGLGFHFYYTNLNWTISKIPSSSMQLTNTRACTHTKWGEK